MSAPDRIISSRFGTVLFAGLIMFGSFLLFIVQPLIARLALPRLGGAPAVWNSAMMVFQILLLGGYAYAHAIGRLPLARQAAIHIALLSAAALALPLSLASLSDPAPGREVVWVPLLFAASIGPVFLLLSAQASLMQRWYAGMTGGRNPYRLFAASNFGSFAGLVAYPFAVEPNLSLSEQSRLWSIGYLLVIGLVAGIALLGRNAGPAADSNDDKSEMRGPIAGRRRMLIWLVLAAVPSGLMLSTTTLLTTDLMAMPLLWIVPLGLYLLSFSVAFSDTGDWARILGTYAPIPLLLVGGLAMISGGQSNPAIALAMVALLFVLGVALHGRLYALRPGTEQLTLFYLIVAAGGALGGTFTALVAPLIFDWVYEHALLLLAAGLLLPHRSYWRMIGERGQTVQGARLFPVVIVIVAAGAGWALSVAVADTAGTRILVFAAVIIMLGVTAVGRRGTFAAVLALLMLGLGGLDTLETSAFGQRSRSYFGVYSVAQSPDGAMRRLNHGTTMHGEQWNDPVRRLQPTAYYGATSGAGLALAGAGPEAKVGIVGLGVGTLSCYRKPAQEWAFFEIDPAILRYSRNRTFTFLSECAPDARIVFGDARLKLAQETAGRFDYLAIDAFTSDAIPIHLLTREAFAVYGRALANDGILLIHISNRFFDLAPMVAALARHGGWHAAMREDFDNPAPGLSQSDWIALSRDQTALEKMRNVSPEPWASLPPPADRAWTDDNASLASLF